MTTSRSPVRASWRRPFSALLALPLLSAGLFAGLTSAASPALAANDQHGETQLVINPGGGDDVSGSDGLRVVLNQDPGYDGSWASEASDQLFFAGTFQFCCGGVGPNLNIGGELYGESGASSGRAEHAWDSFAVVSTAGAVERGSSVTTATGSGAVTVRYTAVKGGLTYTVDRAVSYTFPNDYYTDTYTFTIPAGNTDVVKFYKGGDTSPGTDDEGYGIQLTSPTRSVISLNPASGIQVGQREIAGQKAFDGAVTESYSLPYDEVANGDDLGFHTAAATHDAGFMTQWTLGSTPGTQTHAMHTFVNFQGAGLSADFRSATVPAGTPVLLDLNAVNTALSATPGIGYTFTLPAGLAVAAGTQDNACGGTLTAAVGSSTITLADGTVPLTANCLVSVPVVAAAGGSYAISSASVSGLAVLTNGVGSSSLTVTGPEAPGAPTSVTAVADQSSIQVAWQPPTSGATPAGYRVTASPGSATCTTTGLSCVLGGVAGTSYTVTVVPLTAGGEVGAAASVTTAAVEPPAVPSAPPADAELALTTTDGDISTAEPGQQITVIGSGFLPFSTVTIVIYSTPVTLGTVTTDDSGSFSKLVTVPDSLEAGSHSLLAYGVDPSGTDRSLRLNIAVAAASAGAPAVATPTAATPTATGSGLAYTGSTFDPVPVVVGGTLLVLLGVVLLVVVRSRRRAGEAVSGS